MTGTTTTHEPMTRTLEVPGAVLTYDVRSQASGKRPLLLIGSPMGAKGFTTLAGHFADRTVITYDPRGAERSKRTDGASETTPDEHADDLHRLITTLDLGPVDLFASSGGAVNALALVARHPEDVHTLVAHEPPASSALPDHELVLAVCRDIKQTYLRQGMGPAMAKFIALVSVDGPLPSDYADRPAPDPAMFGLPTQDDGSRDDPLVGQNIVTCNAYEHDFDALRAASTRIVIGVGEESGTNLAGRAAIAVADRLGKSPVVFPGGHDGFSGGEYGYPAAKPEAFAVTLQQVLAQDEETR
jgi:pimeloyl-ACP methyl ester carboxylesterase